ncbi:RHS repeat-associated core domain-containing protein [Povalibacter sp.]|uniref:RHS repeat-associated core domain-containing protein n=1 Tax=Povalibacter sp. TaxID=1962978 RepID=UPI002F3EE9E6
MQGADYAAGHPAASGVEGMGVQRTVTISPDATLRQGFTFQTVLGRMGLNHMNGRVQDAISGTFLSPDPTIPDPMNTQAFNRYAYVYNNPLTLTDPSGFTPDGPPPFFDPCSVGVCDSPDDDGNVLDCFRNGGCRGEYYYEPYNGPKIAPQMVSRQMDRRATARVVSNGNSSMGGLGSWSDTFFSLLRGIGDSWHTAGALSQFADAMEYGEYEQAVYLLDVADQPLFGSIDTPRGHLGYDLAPAAQILAGSAGAGFVGVVRHTIPKSRLGHIFRNAEGHLSNTRANRQLLINVANNPKTMLGPDKYGNVWSALTRADGTQVWVQTRNGRIINGGVNQTPRIYNPDTGLSGL